VTHVAHPKGRCLVEPEFMLIMSILDEKRKELSDEIGSGLTSLAEDACLQIQVALIDELKDTFQKAFGLGDITPTWKIHQSDFATLIRDGEKIPLWMIENQEGTVWGGFETSKEATTYLAEKLC
jgi:hypothetical protein